MTFMDARQIGAYGEMIAARFLRKKGYKILDANFHSRYGEIDLIALDGKTVVFLEVKTRTENAVATPAEAVDGRKREKIKKAAMLYIAGLTDEPGVRYDVVEVILYRQPERKIKVRHLIDAFV